MRNIWKRRRKISASWGGNGEISGERARTLLETPLTLTELEEEDVGADTIRGPPSAARHSASLRGSGRGGKKERVSEIGRRAGWDSGRDCLRWLSLFEGPRDGLGDGCGKGGRGGVALEWKEYFTAFMNLARWNMIIRRTRTLHVRGRVGEHAAHRAQHALHEPADQDASQSRALQHTVDALVHLLGLHRPSL